MQVIHSDARAGVTKTAAILDGVTYPLSAIASIETRTIEPKTGCAAATCWLLGVPLALLAVLIVISPGKPGDGTALAAAIVGLPAALFIWGAVRLGAAKTTYALALTTTAGVKTAFVAEDRGYIDAMRLAIERAIGQSVPLAELRSEISSIEIARSANNSGAPRFSRAIFIDVETTGHHSNDRVVSLGLVLLDVTNTVAPEISTAHLIFDPGRKSHPRAEAVHGYSDWVLRHQPSFVSVAADLRALIAGADLIIAHNVKFDLRFLNREFELAGFDPIDTPTFCTMEAWRASDYGGSTSLSAIAARIGLARVGERHGALEDAWLAMQIFVWMLGLPVAISDYSEVGDSGPTNLCAAPPPPDEPLPRRRRPRDATAGTTSDEPGSDPR